MSDATFKEERARFYRLAACGNELAMDFLCQWHDYCHEIDDVIDTPDYTPARLLALLEFANRLYSHAFYAQHRQVLSPVILVATSIYADSNKWEQDEQLWKRWWAEVLRHCGNEVTYTVAQLCGGYMHVRQITAPLMAMSFIYHKDKYGLPS